MNLNSGWKIWGYSKYICLPSVFQHQKCYWNLSKMNLCTRESCVGDTKRWLSLYSTNNPVDNLLDAGKRVCKKNYDRCLSTFKFSDLSQNLVDAKDLKSKPDKDALQFGKHFTDHMLKVEYVDDEVGWTEPVICRLENLSLHPAAKVFHYAIELFEGLKAYRGYDDKIRIFRPELNMARMNVSSARSNLPQFDPNELLQCICQLLKIEQDWVPRSPNSSLYIRPTIIATEPTLGIGSSKSALLFVILSPVGAYFASGIDPISLLADPRFIRAWPGGVGNIKMGSNYAPTIHVQKKAQKKGHQQVLWLYGDDYQLTEAGTMNLFVVIKNSQGDKEIITPPLNGLILPGITRQSVIELARQWKEFQVTERIVTMSELLEIAKEGRLLEMFGSGTACVVSPINGIWFDDELLKVPTMEQKEPVFQKILEALTDLQYGRIDHPWTRVIN